MEQSASGASSVSSDGVPIAALKDSGTSMFPEMDSRKARLAILASTDGISVSSHQRAIASSIESRTLPSTPCACRTATRGVSRVTIHPSGIEKTAVLPLIVCCARSTVHSIVGSALQLRPRIHEELDSSSGGPGGPGSLVNDGLHGVSGATTAGGPKPMKSNGSCVPARWVRLAVYT